MKHVVVLLSLVVGLAGCAYRPARLSGLEFETLHLPRPLPGGPWSPVTESFGDTTRTRWTRLDGSLELAVRRSRDLPSPALFRRDADVLSQQTPPLTFHSTLLRDGEMNGYPASLWQTVATLPGGGSTSSLRLYIRGNDASYALQRTWNTGSVSAAERQKWLEFLQAVSVCDPRTPEHPCPPEP